MLEMVIGAVIFGTGGLFGAGLMFEKKMRRDERRND